MLIEVFVQNEAGSNLKSYHNEKTLEFQFARTVSHAYPYPYGFIIGTDASDGCNVDHNVLAKLPGENIELTAGIQTILTDFVLNVFAHEAGKQITVGRFLDAEYAAAHIIATLEHTGQAA